MSTSSPTNIDASEKQLRLYAGLGAFGVGLLLSCLLLITDYSPVWRLGLFIPFWGGALGIFQFWGGI